MEVSKITTASGSQLDIKDATARKTISDLKSAISAIPAVDVNADTMTIVEAINLLLSKFRTAATAAIAVAVVGLTVSSASAAEPKTAPHNRIKGNVSIVTNTVEYVTGSISAHNGSSAAHGDIRAAVAEKQDMPGEPVESPVIAYQQNGAAVMVTVPASGTLSASVSGWTEGQAQTAFILLTPGCSVASNVRLVGYGSWPTDSDFVATCIRVGSNVYVTPVVAIAE